MGGKTTKIGALGDKGKEYVSRDRNMPVLTQSAKSPMQAVSGAGKVLSGDVKGGLGDMWESAKGGLPMVSMMGFNSAPDPTYVGGSPEELAARRAQQNQGIAQGAAYTQGGMETSAGGAGMIGQAYGQAGLDRGLAQGMAADGSRIGQAGLGSQNQAIAGMLSTAGQRGPSAAEAQMRMGLDQTQQAMMAQAASARGGNAAAAMRTAQAGGAQMAGQMNQQAAILRAQEEAQQRAQLIGAQQAAAGMYGGQAGLGYGMQGQGLGLGQASTNMQGQMGSNVGSIGLGQAQAGNQMQGNYLGAQTATDKSQLEADTQQSSAKQGAKGGLFGAAGKVIGSIFGG